MALQFRGSLKRGVHACLPLSCLSPAAPTSAWLGAPWKWEGVAAISVGGRFSQGPSDLDVGDRGLWPGDYPEEGSTTGTAMRPCTSLLFARKAFTCVSSPLPTVDRRPTPRAVPGSEWTQHQPGQPPMRPPKGPPSFLGPPQVRYAPTSTQWALELSLGACWCRHALASFPTSRASKCLGSMQDHLPPSQEEPAHLSLHVPGALEVRLTGGMLELT